MDPRHQHKQETNIFPAIIVALIAVVGWQFYQSTQAPDTAAVAQTQAAAVPGQTTPGAPALPQEVMATGADVASGAGTSARVEVNASHLSGSIALTGGRLDMLSLTRYETELGASDPVTLFAPEGARTHFFDAGWQSADIAVPTGDTPWQAALLALTPDAPLVLTWDNGSGQIFTRTFTLTDDQYLIRVTDDVINNSSTAIRLGHYAQLHRSFTGDIATDEMGTFYNPLGPMAYIDGRKYEHDFDHVKDHGRLKEQGSRGWIGIKSQYFLAALVPDQQQDTLWQFRYSRINGQDFYSVITQTPGQITVAGGGRYQQSYQLYAGPNVRAEMVKADVNLEEAVDYGWFHFIALPIFKMIAWFYSLIGNMGVAIILGTIIIKVVLWPLSAKSYRSMAKLKEIQPEFLKIKERYGDNREGAAMAMMKLYQEQKVNPMSGCWPMLLQIPIFFAFYKVILVSFEFRHAPFMLWIDDLSVKDPFFVLPILMGLTMFWQQKLNPPATDPMQEKVMKLLPFIFTIMFMMFPAGLVLYWTTNNLLSVLQQWFITRQVSVREVK